MKVVYCSTALSPGGELTWFRRTLGALDRSRYEPVICSLRPPRADEQALRNLGAPVLSLGVTSPYNVIGAAWRLRRFMKEHRADLIHMSLFGSELTPFLGAALGRKPLLATVNTTMDPGVVGKASGSRRTEWTLRLARLAQAALAKVNSTHFVALSDSVADSTRKFLRATDSNLTVVNIGLDLGEYIQPDPDCQALKETLGIQGRWPLLVNVARLSHAKDQVQAIRAMPEVMLRHPKALLMIVGEGPLRQELESEAARLHVERHVRFLGRRDDVRRLLKLSDVFVFTSRYEGQPHAVVEAMAAAVPVVAFRIPATSELIEHGRSGILVDERDPGQFAEAVLRLLDRPIDAQEMGKRALETVTLHFDIATNTRKLERLYDAVLVRAGRRPASLVGTS